MAVSYKKLWKLLIDRDMKRKTYVRLQVSVMLQWRNSEKMKMLQQMCW